MVDRTCPVCGKNVEPQARRRGPTKVYCSKRCTDTAYDRRRKGCEPRAICQKCRVQPASDGKRTCAPCQARRSIAWRLKTKYGTTIEWYDETMLRQGGRCAICRAKLDELLGNGLHKFIPRIDHDHVTGTPRGLLCHSCNVAIGLLGDDPERIARAAEYVRTHRQLRLAI